MVAENTSISQEGSNFHKKTAKKIIMPPNFQKFRFEMQIKFTNFYSIYGNVASHFGDVYTVNIESIPLHL